CSFFCPLHPPCSTLFPYTTLFRSSNLYLLSSLQDEQFLHHTLYLLYRHMFFLLSESQKSFVYHAYQNKWLVEVGTLLEKILDARSEEHTSELQSRFDLVCRLLLEK